MLTLNSAHSATPNLGEVELLADSDETVFRLIIFGSYLFQAARTYLAEPVKPGLAIENCLANGNSNCSAICLLEVALGVAAGWDTFRGLPLELAWAMRLVNSICIRFLLVCCLIALLLKELAVLGVASGRKQKAVNGVQMGLYSPPNRAGRCRRD